MTTDKESNKKFTSTKKKQWHKPQIQQLDVQKTLNGGAVNKNENPHWTGGNS